MELFAATAPGIAAITARELEELGIVPDAIAADGVTFQGDFAVMQRANVELRTASRVLVRMGTFGARTFAELERHAKKLNWSAFLAAGGKVRFRVTARKCRLFHTGAIAERLANATGAAVTERGEDASAQLFVVRGLRDEWLVSADSSGEHLHRRGYRLATTRAPLRETLAAAGVLVSGWDRRSPLADPFCGSGTICIEAALITAGRAPGSDREFAFTSWPGHVWPAPPAVAAAAGIESPAVFGYDRDAGAIQSAADNARRAGVAAMIEFARQSLSDFDPPADRGWIVTNPPYGVRVGERGPLRDLYARFGAIVRERCAGWRIAFYSADPALERATGLSLRPVFRTENGGLRVRLVTTEV